MADQAGALSIGASQRYHFSFFFPLSCIQPKLSCIQAAAVGWLYGFMVFLGQLTGYFCLGDISVHSSWIGELEGCTYSTFCPCMCFFWDLKNLCWGVCWTCGSWWFDGIHGWTWTKPMCPTQWWRMWPGSWFGAWRSLGCLLKSSFGIKESFPSSAKLCMTFYILLVRGNNVWMLG